MPRNVQNWIYSEAGIQKAIYDVKNGRAKSIRGAAAANSIPYQTLQNRLKGRDSRVVAHEHKQILSPVEEKTLFKWITRLTCTGFPATPALVVEMAEEIRRARVQLSPQQQQPLLPIGEKWIYRFRNRYPDLKGIWTRQLDTSRFRSMNRASLETYFDVVLKLYQQHQYQPQHIYNMDESGFSVGDSQSSRVLVNARTSSGFKQIGQRQEWITAIECVSAAGVAIAPLIIFKAQHTNSSWIPARTPREWRFSTSNSGWTSDSHGIEWLTSVFHPLTYPPVSTDPPTRRLLIMDGHSSHITANVISFCMHKAIDLLILPPHTSQITQPLDIGLFGPLKSMLAKETDCRLRLDSGRIPKAEWIEMYIKARARAFTTSNILSGWRGAGLWPFSPVSVLEKVSETSVHVEQQPRTPPQEEEDLDLTLLGSSPPVGTELRSANKVFKSAIQTSDVSTPVKRYAQRLALLSESSTSQLTTSKRTIRQQDDLLNVRKKRTSGKRVKIEGKFVFTTEEVF